MLYSLSLLWMKAILLLNQIHSSLLEAMLARLFLFLIPSLSMRRQPSFFNFRHSSMSFLLLFKVITSVLVWLTCIFPYDSIFHTSRITFDLVFYPRLKKHKDLHILTRLTADLISFSLATIGDTADVYWYIFNFFTEISQIMFNTDCAKRSTLSISGDPIFDANVFMSAL